MSGCGLHCVQERVWPRTKPVRSAVLAFPLARLSHRPRGMSSQAAYGHLALTQRFMNLEWRLENAAPEIHIPSDSPGMQRVLGVLERAAKTDETLLLRGEVGAGKTALAWITHERSARRDGPFVAVSCPALRERVVSKDTEDGTLRATSLRAAVGMLRGHFAEASGGTLFLDEVEELPQPLEATLARLIPSPSSVRAGATETRASNVRIVRCHQPRRRGRWSDEPEPVRRAGRDRGADSAAARATGGHSPSRAAFPPLRGHVDAASGPTPVAGGEAAARGTRLAGKRPRVEKRHGACADCILVGRHRYRRVLRTARATMSGGPAREWQSSEPRKTAACRPSDGIRRRRPGSSHWHERC